MFKKYKQFIMGFLIGAMLFSGISVFAETRTINAIFNNIKLSLDGVLIDLKDANSNPIEIFSINGTTYLPVRVLSEALNLTVKYNETTNTVELIRKEESVLMSETVKTTNISNNKIKYSKDNNGVIILTQFGIDYVDMFSVETNVIRKHDDMFNKYLFEYNKETNIGLIKHINLNNQMTEEERIKGIILSKDDKTTIVLNNIPIHQIQNTNSLIQNTTPLVKYDYYLENIKPLFP